MRWASALTSIFDLVFTVGLAAMNRREPSLGVGFAFSVLI
jgi:hypothetical protein